MKKVMFVCRRNSCRSQMAEAFMKHLSAGQCIVHSSGLEASTVHPGAIAIMQEIGLDLSTQTSNALAEFSADDYDAVISMCGCGVSLPPEWLDRDIFEDWDILDPDGQTLDVFREVREQIKARVKTLMTQLIPTSES